MKNTLIISELKHFTVVPMYAYIGNTIDNNAFSQDHVNRLKTRLISIDVIEYMTKQESAGNNECIYVLELNDNYNIKLSNSCEMIPMHVIVPK